MKVLCVGNEKISLTVGKWYFVEYYEDDFSSDHFKVKDDTGRYCLLNRKYFRTIEELREEKLNEIGIV